MNDEHISHLWADVKANYHVKKMQEALNVAKTTEYSKPEENYQIARQLMKCTERHLSYSLIKSPSSSMQNIAMRMGFLITQ